MLLDSAEWVKEFDHLSFSTCLGLFFVVKI